MRRLIVFILGLTFAPQYGAVAAPARSVAEITALIKHADPGAIVIVPPGLYAGHLVINKPMTLDGAGAATIDGGGNGVVVDVTVPGVTIRGFTIRGSGESVTGEPSGIRVFAAKTVIENNRIEDALFGIDLRESPDSIIRNNSIRGKNLEPGRRGDGIRLWWSHNCIIEDNDVRGSRDMVFWYSEGLEIRRNRVSDSRYGLHFMYSHDTTLADNTLEANSVGVYLMYSNNIRLVRNRMTDNRGSSGYGLGLKDCDHIEVQENAMLANRVGIYLDNSPSSIESTGLIESNLIAHNEIGLLATPNTHRNVFTGNAFVENEQQAASHGRGELSGNAFAYEGIGNFWSDYPGFDRDDDGVGDLIYEPQDLFASMLSRTPNLRILVHSPAQRAIEFTARALPELRPAPTLSDPAPLTRPPAVMSMKTENQRSAWPMGLLSIAFVLTSTGLAWRLCHDDWRSMAGSLPTESPQQ